MRPKDFCDPPGEVAPIGKHYAFVPWKLPPRIDASKFIDDNEEAVLALGELRATVPFLPNPGLFTAPFLRREAVLSSKIEGTRTELGQLYLFEAGGPNRKQKGNSETVQDATEVHNYVIALEHGLGALQELPICNRLIKQVHEKLFAGTTRNTGHFTPPGTFRSTQVFIGDGEGIDGARYVPPPASRVEVLMRDLEKYANQRDHDLPKLIRIAILHYQFEAIHPFNDGNGRVGRLLISLLLASWQLLPEPLLYLSAYFQRHKKPYISLLWDVSRANMWDEWIRFFLHGVREEARDATKRAKQMLELREKYREELLHKGGGGKLLLLVDELFRYPVLTVNDAKESLGVTYNAAKKTIEKLVAAGILAKPEGTRQRNKFYLAEEILQILE